MAVVGVAVQVRCITVLGERVSARDVLPLLLPLLLSLLSLVSFPRFCFPLESSSPSCFLSFLHLSSFSPPHYTLLVFPTSSLHILLCFSFPFPLSFTSFRNAHTLACICTHICIYTYTYGHIHTHMHYLSPTHEGNLALSSSLCRPWWRQGKHRG